MSQCPNGCGDNTLVTSVTMGGLVRSCCKCGANVALPAPQQVVAQAPSRPTQTTTRAAPAKPMTVLQQARARVAELRRELKRMRALERELNELTRLIGAAKRKPSDGGAVVRPLRKQG